MIAEELRVNETDQTDKQKKRSFTCKKYVLLISGILSLVFGVVGIFVPILPTTPFLLLTAICFLNSSPGAYHWFVSNRLFGKFIKDYRDGKGVSKRFKIITISLLWITIILSILIISSFLVKIMLVIIAIIVSIHIILIKPKEKMQTE